VAVIRVFSFQAARKGFDEILRTELVPDLLGKAGLRDWYVGRQGPDDAGPRVVATVWDRRESMIDALGEQLGTFHPEYLDATVGQRLEVMELLIDWRSEREDVRILRLLRGQVREGELGAYVEDVERGVQLDASDGHGPAALYLAESGRDAFVTVSAWRDWSDIEQATGGDVRHPLATRHPERLVAWDVQLFEVVQI
jgi:hypothetical protein